MAAMTISGIDLWSRCKYVINHWSQIRRRGMLLMLRLTSRTTTERNRREQKGGNSQPRISQEFSKEPRSHHPWRIWIGIIEKNRSQLRRNYDQLSEEEWSEYWMICGVIVFAEIERPTLTWKELYGVDMISLKGIFRKSFASTWVIEMSGGNEYFTYILYGVTKLLVS